MKELFEAIFTKRLIIRPESIADASSLKELLDDHENRPFNDKIIGLTLTKLEKSIAENRRLFSIDANSIISDKANCHFSILDKNSNEYFGYLIIKYQKIIDKVELGYGIKNDKRGNGYALEAAQAGLTFAFDIIKLPELFAAVNPKNTPSLKILNRIGMKYVKDTEWPNQGNVNVYSLTRIEYENMKGKI